MGWTILTNDEKTTIKVLDKATSLSGTCSCDRCVGTFGNAIQGRQMIRTREGTSTVRVDLEGVNYHGWSAFTQLNHTSGVV